MLRSVHQKISIDCKYLDSDIESHILSKIKNIMTGCWSLNYGYILKVVRIIKIGDNHINNATSLVVFDVDYEIETLKPEQGLILSGKVGMVFCHGIFVVIHKIIGNKLTELFQVLIPVKNLVNLKFDRTNKCFRSATKTISENDDINIKITTAQYSDNKYICIGNLVNNV